MCVSTAAATLTKMAYEYTVVSPRPKSPVDRVDRTMVELSLALLYQWAGRLMLSLH
jgi:hypothetical protein